MTEIEQKPLLLVTAFLRLKQSIKGMITWNQKTTSDVY